MEALLGIVIFFGYVAVRMGKLVGKATGGKTAGANTAPRPAQTKSTYTRPGTGNRSFAAMPKQTAGIPNVERNCSAEEKHRFENNVSGHGGIRTTAIPNVPSSNMHKQPKMSGNRKAAKQLYIGDVVPRGNRVITCSYCAADNIVPAGARNEYKCYFCHYDI